MMKNSNVSPKFALAAALSLLCAVPSISQQPQGGNGFNNRPLDPSIKRTYVPLAGGAYLYEPVSPGEKSQIAILVMHSNGNYMNHSACSEMSKRGYRVLCENKSGQTTGDLDTTIMDARRGVEYLRTVGGVKKVVLLGHSGGATLMSSYQMIAENGVHSCQGPEKLHKCPDRLADLPAADGLMLIDSNWGNAEMNLFSVDPAVVSEDGGMSVNPDLDLFNPKNGFNPSGNSDYSPEFIRKWQTAEGERNNKLIRMAQDRLAAIEVGRGRYIDDEPFTVPGSSGVGGNNKLFAQDTKLMSHTVHAWPLLHADGSATTGVVPTVRVPENLKSQTPSLAGGATNTTVRTFLVNAVRVSSDFGYDEDSVRGVEWTSSYASPPGNVESIHVPLLVMGMTGHWEYLAAETIYEQAKSYDKALAFVEGATHNYTTCKACEKTPGQFGDTQKTTYDYVEKWLSHQGRFMGGEQR